jgi:hypothetical protein
VSQQLHQSRQADTQPEHLRSEGVTQAVRSDRVGAVGSARRIG